MIENENLKAKINQMVPLIYLLSDDEHRAIQGIHEIAINKKISTEVFIYRSTVGIISYNDYIKDID